MLGQQVSIRRVQPFGSAAPKKLAARTRVVVCVAEAGKPMQASVQLLHKPGCAFVKDVAAKLFVRQGHRCAGPPVVTTQAILGLHVADAGEQGALAQRAASLRRCRCW